MALRVGFDLDGVLADLDRAILEIAAQLFGPDQVETVAGGTCPRLSAGQSHLTWTVAFETPDFWETLSETEPGIVARIDRESRQRGWEVIFVTQRPPTAGQPVEDQSRRWLARHGFPEARVVLAPDSRGVAVDQLGLDLAVDDRPENCASIVAESRAGALLVWRESWGPLSPRALSPGIAVVPTAAAALDWLADRGKDPPEALGGRPSIQRTAS